MSYQQKNTLSGLSLLIVDDNDDNVLVLKSLVQEHFPELDVYSAANADEGFRLAKTKAIDTALIDVQMPGTDGVDLCQMLKEDANTCNIAIILLTSHNSTAELRSLGLEAGADDFIQRPFDNVEFIARVKVMLRLKLSQINFSLVNDNLEALVEQKVAQQRASESRLQSTLDAAENVAFVTSEIRGEDTEIIDFSPGAENLFGYRASEIVGRSLSLLSPSEEVPSCKASSIRLHREDGCVSGEATLVRKSGEHFPALYSVHPLVDHDGKHTGTLSVAVDITERKRAENILNAELQIVEYAEKHTVQELLQFFLDKAELLTASTIGFYHFLENNLQEVSLQAWSTRTLQEFCTVSDLKHKYPLDDAGVWVDAVRQGKAVVHNDYASLPHKKGLPEGHAKIVRQLVVPVFREEKIVAILGVGNKDKDYTQEDIKTLNRLSSVVWETIVRMRAEAARTMLIEKIEKQNQELQEMVFAVSHDLRTPLVSIQGFNGILEESVNEILNILEDMDSDPELCKALNPHIDTCRNALDYISNGATSMYSLLKGLLAYSRTGRVDIERQLIDMPAMMDDIIKTFNYQLTENNIDFEVAPPPDCVGDKSLVYQLFVNLIDNAVKYSDAVRPNAISITGWQEEQRAVYCVADKGVGIPDAFKLKIFDVFHQLSPEAAGEGLGLSIVRRIVERHNGKIWVESEPDVGSRFYVSLPGGSSVSDC